MFPEGDPASAPIQEILYWQTRTIEMMYKRVGDAIKASGNQTHPTDWLMFLCPGKFVKNMNISLDCHFHPPGWCQANFSSFFSVAPVLMKVS